MSQETVAPGKKDAAYELVGIPEPLGPVEVTVSAETCRSFAAAVGYGHGPDPHPLVLANELLFLFYDKYDGNTARGLHTHEQLEFLSPVRVGETARISGAYVDKYERRGQGYVVLDAVAHGEDGRELVRHRGIEIMRTHAGGVVGRQRTGGAPTSGRRVSGEVRAGAQAVGRAAAGLAPRTPIVPLVKRVSQEQMFAFSWGDRGFRNVHTDPQVAADLGLDRTLVQAQQQTSYLAEAMTGFFGSSFLTTGELDLRFVAPAFVDDTLVVEGAVLGERQRVGVDVLELEVWVRREGGPRTVIGWASAVVD